MKKQIAIALLSITTAFAGIVPAQAFPSYTPAPAVASPNQATLVKDSIADVYGNRRWIQRDRGNRDGNWRYNRGDRYDRRYYRDGYYRDRHYRRGSNTGAIIGGLAAGALIGGALAAPTYSSPRRYVGEIPTPTGAIRGTGLTVPRTTHTYPAQVSALSVFRHTDI